MNSVNAMPTLSRTTTSEIEIAEDASDLSIRNTR